MILPMDSAMRRDRPGLLAITVALLSHAPASQAAPLPAGSPPAVTPSRASGTQGWDGMPMGQRSAAAHFIVMMIRHHRMGVMMASHAQGNTLHPELRQLEAAMVRMQNQEIEQMAQWYQKWYGSGAR